MIGSEFQTENDSDGLQMELPADREGQWRALSFRQRTTVDNELQMEYNSRWRTTVVGFRRKETVVGFGQKTTVEGFRWSTIVEGFRQRTMVDFR